MIPLYEVYFGKRAGEKYTKPQYKSQFLNILPKIGNQIMKVNDKIDFVSLSKGIMDGIDPNFHKQVTKTLESCYDENTLIAYWNPKTQAVAQKKIIDVNVGDQVLTVEWKDGKPHHKLEPVIIVNIYKQHPL